MPELILHHFTISPFSEKVRLALGYKQLAWKSVLIPAIMPKPDVVALTGGYRRTPVLQVGAGGVAVDTAIQFSPDDAKPARLLGSLLETAPEQVFPAADFGTVALNGAVVVTGEAPPPSMSPPALASPQPPPPTPPPPLLPSTSPAPAPAPTEETGNSWGAADIAKWVGIGAGAIVGAAGETQLRGYASWWWGCCWRWRGAGLDCLLPAATCN